MRLLLINPRAPESFWSFRWAVDRVLPRKRAVNPPLGLATLAALTPASWEIEIVDENVEVVPTAPEADVIGICGMGVQFARQAELLRFFRERGYYVVAGGSYASLCPETYADLADTVVAGEAEYIWPQFCADFEAGQPKPLYRECGEVSLHDSPVPRFDLLKLDRYAMVSMQFSRGCPFQCEFCDIIVMFGRKPRTKTPAQICSELDLLRAHGVRNIFFVDDNFIGNKPQARELVRSLADYQHRHGYAFRFGTEASLNLAQDEELMQGFRAANFRWVFIGIESPDEESLRETRKLQNIREDMQESLRRLYAHGIDVFAGFIVGFDNDALETFDRQHDFITRSGIQVAMVGLLTALPRTPLYQRLKAEGRLLGEALDNTSLWTNVVPKRMTLDAMREGYQRLYARLLSDRGVADRIRAKMRQFVPSRNAVGYGAAEQLRIAARLLFRGIFPGGWRRWWHFSRSVLLATPRQFPSVMSDWISGLSMKKYAERHLVSVAEHEIGVFERSVARLRARLSRLIDEGALELKLESARQALPSLRLTLRRPVDTAAVTRAARQIASVLRRTRTTVTLHVECDVAAVEKLLARLEPYGDRVSVAVAGAVPALAAVDWSRFHLIIQRT